VTLTPTITLTPTATVQAGSTPVIFPNPVTDGVLEVLPQTYPGMSWIKVQVFTPSWKPVLKKEFPPTLAGQTVRVELLDDWGEPLAGGVYYVRVTTKKDQKTVTLVVLR
jgi:hypothetical protein